MRIHRQQFKVVYDYPVYFGFDVLSPESPALADAISRREPARRHRVAFLVEERVAELWPRLLGDIARYCDRHSRRLHLVAEPLLLEGGEAVKNDPAAPARLQRVFDDWKMDRQSVVVVIGGGALQDMAGYAAATTHRGIRVVRLPTTVLAQNDSGVGVKTGINARGKKNFLGTFTPPFAVIDDFRFLETLDVRDKRAGMAEAVKVALIKDGTFFDWLEQNARALSDFDAAAVAHMIERCATLHLEHIAGGGDPFELGSSRPLDFGHWAAHKLESLSDYSLRHGEAVGIGIALDTRYSKEAGFIAEEAAERTIGLLERLGLGTYHSALDERDATGRRVLLDGIDEFREHLGGELTVMMLEEIGRGREVYELKTDLIDRSIAWLCRRAEGDAAPLRPTTSASPPSPAAD